MARREDLVEFDRACAEFEAWRAREDARPLAEEERGDARIWLSKLPYSVRAKLVAGLNNVLPSLIDDIRRNARGELVQEVVNDARETLGELGPEWLKEQGS